MCTVYKKLKTEKVWATRSPWHVHRRSINNCQLEPGSCGDGRDRANSCHCSLPLRLDVGDDLPSCVFPNESWLMPSTVTGKQTYQAFKSSSGQSGLLWRGAVHPDQMLKLPICTHFGLSYASIWRFPCFFLFCSIGRIMCLGHDGIPHTHEQDDQSGVQGKSELDGEPWPHWLATAFFNNWQNSVRI